jgi:hypothetical protein
MGDRCGAKTTRGGGHPCKHPAGYKTTHRGTGRCWLHGGATPNGQKAAAAELIHEAVERRRLAELDKPRRLVNPTDVLLDEVALCDLMVAWMGAGLAAWERSGQTEHPLGLPVDGEPELHATSKETGKAYVVGTAGRLHALSDGLPALQQVVYSDRDAVITPTELALWLREFRAEREHRRRVSTAAIQMDLERRKVLLEEAQAFLVLRIVDTVLERLGVESDQARAILPAVIRDVTGEDAPAALTA